MDKVEKVVHDRQRSAALFTQKIADLQGVVPQHSPVNSASVFWKYVVRIEPQQAKADVKQIADYLRVNYGIASAPRYVQKPAFECEVFKKQKTFGRSRFPFAGPHVETITQYSCDNFQGTYDALSHMLVLPWNENYSAGHVNYIAAALHEAVEHFQNHGN